jgi:hypothetical protein
MSVYVGIDVHRKRSQVGVNDERDWAPDLRPDRVPSPDAGTRIRAVGPHG